MISFTSLFLGLVLGTQVVQVAVDDSVAKVEIHLDGHLIGAIERPPWRLRCDLGDELAPHYLDAVAFDEAGQEAARATQWINVPRQPAEITILLDGGSDGRGRLARVTWESLAGSEPSAVRVSFDGVDLAVSDPAAVELPAHDPTRLHFLRVELEFADFLTSVGEVTFGGVYADSIRSELTAVPIVVKGRRKTPAAADLEGRFTVAGRAAEVAAVDKGRAEVVVVRDSSSFAPLRSLRGLVLADPPRKNRWFRRLGPGWGDWTVQFLAPVPRRQSGGARTYDLFPFSVRYSGRERSLQGWISSVGRTPVHDDLQRLADAVAVAGIQAAAGNRRRAVLLVLGDSPQDRGDIPPGQARRYLERLQVPLVVWSVVPRSDSATAAWGDISVATSPAALERAAGRLTELVERQRIVWLTGIHLPDRIALDPGPENVSLLAGAEP